MWVVASHQYMTPSERFEVNLHEVLAKQFRYSVLPSVRVFRPSHVESRAHGYEIDNLMHIAFEGSDYIVLVEAKNQRVHQIGDRWVVTYDSGEKCAKKQVQEHVATLREYLRPLGKQVDLRFVAIVVSADAENGRYTFRPHPTEEYYCAPVDLLPEMLSERFNLRKRPDRPQSEIPRINQSPFLELLRLGVPHPGLGHPELPSAIRYVERCRRTIDEAIFKHFSPTPERWAINGSAGMGKSVLLGYAACVFSSKMQLDQVMGRLELKTAEPLLKNALFSSEQGAIGVFAMSQRQLDNLRGWYDYFASTFRSLDMGDIVRFRRPEFHLCRTMSELEQKTWSVVLLDEAHDLEENVAKRLAFRFKKDGFYLMVACDRHQKLRLAGSDAKIVEGLDFSSRTKRLRQIYRNPSAVYIASLAIMFRWFGVGGPMVMPTKEELEGAFGFEVDGSVEDGYSLRLRNDSHPANLWSYTVGTFPDAAVAHQFLCNAKLGRREVLWIRFSGEDPDFDYEQLHNFTYHNFRTQEADSLTDKYVKGQDFPVVVIEGFPSFMDRWEDDNGEGVDEAKMWKFRRELYLCSSRATSFLYFVIHGTGTPEAERISTEIQRLTNALAHPGSLTSQGSRFWEIAVQGATQNHRRKMDAFYEAAPPHEASPNSLAEDWHRTVQPVETKVQGDVELVESPLAPIYVLNGETTVAEMARKMGYKVFHVVKDLIEFKVWAKTDSVLTERLQILVAQKRGFEVRKPSVEESLDRAISES